MNKLEALTALRDKVKAGECDHGSFLQDWHGSPSYSGGCGVNAHKAYDGSLDAAKALHEAVLPKWRYFGGLSVVSDGYLYTVYHPEFYDCEAASNMDPARAWLLAILEALIAQEKDT